MAEQKPPQQAGMWFICQVCKIQAPEPILCVKQKCPTEHLVLGHVSTRKH